MAPIINEVGHVYGRLTVIAPVMRDGRRHWQCRCACGGSSVVYGGSLRRGLTQSCGCLQRERTIATKTIHGDAGPVRRFEYRAWEAMKRRVLNPQNPDWPDYGGRGITLCERWRQSFASFLEDMGRCPPKHSLDRMDVNGPYDKQNCRWATWKEQGLNRRDVRHATLDDERISIADMAHQLAMKPTTLAKHLRKVERSLSAA